MGVNIEKGLNPEDGTFGLPTAAVVTDVNGNLVADGTPVNFSTTPRRRHLLRRILALHRRPGPITSSATPWPIPCPGPITTTTGSWIPDEALSAFDLTRSRPARGEDKDGNGFINFPPEPFSDLNGDGSLGLRQCRAPGPVARQRYLGAGPILVDFNKNGDQGRWWSPYSDFNNDGRCQCTGTRDPAGNLYEQTYFGSTSTHPFPGEVCVGITKQVSDPERKIPEHHRLRAVPGATRSRSASPRSPTASAASWT